MINVFQIYPGDIIINGSDGKDDILIPDQSGTQTMNHNENRILSIIEKAEGNLDKIVESLEKESGITDDLSLMRITWDGIPKPHLKELKFIHKSIKELDTILSGIRLGLADLEILKNLAISYFRKRQFAKAIICLDEYMETFPSDTEMLYVGGRIIRKSEHAKESVEFAERMRLRNPQHIKNIYNLKRIYKKLGNVERARKFEEEYKNMRNRLLEKVY
jgi:tetratricopeptide (TPR) repeat protein